MRATFAIAALAGSAVAAPNWGGYGGKKEEVTNVHVIVETVVETVYVTEGYEATYPTPSAVYSAQPIYTPPAEVTTIVYEAPSSQYQAPPAPPSSQYQAPPAPTPTPEQPKPTPTPAPAPSSVAPPPAAGTGYMAIVAEYRQKLGLKPLTRSDKLESNVENCLESSPGQMEHKLNAGTYGQVLAPIPDMSDASFKHAFVGGWLCEISSLLPDECPTQSQGWMYEGQTGHAEILTSPNYSEIGCRFFDGIVGCDLA